VNVSSYVYSHVRLLCDAEHDMLAIATFVVVCVCVGADEVTMLQCLLPWQQ